jgi:hypothetical protein
MILQKKEYSTPKMKETLHPKKSFFRSSRKIVVVAVVVLGVLTLMIYFQVWKLFQDDFSGNPVIATVGQEKIYFNDFFSRFKMMYQGQWELLSPDEKTALAMGILDHMIQNKILLRETEKIGLPQNDELETKIDAMLDASLVNWDQQQYHLERNDITREEFRKRIEENIMALKVKELLLLKEMMRVSDQEIDTYYQNNIQDFTVEQATFHLRQLVFDSHRLGQKVFLQLQKRSSFEDEFEKLRKKGQECPEILDLHELTLEDLEPEEAQLITKANEGDFVSFTHENGEYIIDQVVEKKEKGILPLAKVSEEIKNSLLAEKHNQAFEKWLHSQYDTLPVRIQRDILIGKLSSAQVTNNMQGYEEDNELFLE